MLQDFHSNTSEKSLAKSTWMKIWILSSDYSEQKEKALSLVLQEKRH